MVEMGENRTPRPEHVPRELPTGISGQLAFRVADPRPAGCLACYPVVPLGSLTPLTGVGDAAPPLMTSSPSGEGGRRRCSLRLSSEGVTIVASYSNCPLFYEACEHPRPAIPGSRALSKPDIPTNRSGPILPDRFANVNGRSISRRHCGGARPRPVRRPNLHRVHAIPSRAPRGVRIFTG